MLHRARSLLLDALEGPGHGIWSSSACDSASVAVGGGANRGQGAAARGGVCRAAPARRGAGMPRDAVRRLVAILAALAALGCVVNLGAAYVADRARSAQPRVALHGGGSIGLPTALTESTVTYAVDAAEDALATAPRARDGLDAWRDLHAQLKQDAARAAALAGRAQPSVVFVGDSTIEALRGTMMLGMPLEVLGGDAPVGADAELAHAFDPDGEGRSKPLVLGVSGDETQNVIWRLGEGGELADGLCGDAAGCVFVVHCGTNNLSSRDGSGGIVARGGGAAAVGAVGVAKLLLEQRPSSRVVLSALLPRTQRRGMHLRGVCEVNARIPALLRDLPANLAARVGWADCSGAFVRMDGLEATDASTTSRHGAAAPTAAQWCPHVLERLGGAHDAADSSAEDDLNFLASAVARELLPDGLHPSAAGYRRWLKCIRRAVEHAERDAAAGN